ncbi:MAG: NAD(P)-dependent alcohol dehydrogenase, partial [Bacteroidales bacterium]|nr:NAD(P)-dependent alcohol dehydrogenase [Bacteroidales bacterium]
MKAAIHENYGTPDVIYVGEQNKPIPSKNEVLVKVRAATVNRTDCANLKAKPYIMRSYLGLFKPKKPVLGTDFAGEVVEIGSDVTQYRVGDRVFGFHDEGIGSHAQFLKISTKKYIYPMPVNATFEESAAGIEGFHYAYNFINKVKLKSGDKVLVNGASGAIGSALVQLLKYFNVNVTAVCGTNSIEVVKSLGVDYIIDYLKEDFTKTKSTYHYIFDTVGKSSYFKCKNILKPGGAYASSELGYMSQNLFLPILTRLGSKRKVKFPFPSNLKQSLMLAKKLMEENRFKPVIER